MRRAARAPPQKVPLEWSKVEIRLVSQGDEAGLVAGVDVVLTGNAFPGRRTSNGLNVLRQRTNDDGKVSFGPIQAGEYMMRIETSKRVSHIRSESLVLYPSKDEHVEMTCPNLSEVERRISIELPQGMRSRGIAFVCYFRASHSDRHQRSREWVTRLPGHREWAIAPADGQVMTPSEHGDSAFEPSGAMKWTKERLRVRKASWQAGRGVTLPTGPYVLHQMDAVRLRSDGANDSFWKYNVLARHRSRQPGMAITFQVSRDKTGPIEIVPPESMLETLRQRLADVE